MSRIAGSPLSALADYYRRLEADPKQTVPRFGFTREKVHFQVVINADGSIAGFEDIRETNERGRAIPRLMIVPDNGGRSGTGTKPFFCWDNTGYALGRDNKGRPDRAEAMFAAFRELHRRMRGQVGPDEGYEALCRFLEHWEPKNAEGLGNWEEAAGKNVVFRLRGRQGFIHESDAVREAWRPKPAEPDTDESSRGVSLINGEEGELARLHSLIGGVAGANTTGAAIVSFNLDAFESYGKTQSFNAPVGIRDAFYYTTALNYLLADKVRRIQIGDATVVFWSDSAEAREADEVFAVLFGESVPAGETTESGRTVDRLRAFLTAARHGKIADHLSDPDAPDAPFYVLGLSPNASRINVRFWLAGTVSQFAERLGGHQRDLEMTGERPGDPPLLIRRLLLETAREPKDVSAQLAGELARAVLGGLHYPHALFGAVIRRVRTDTIMNHRRAAILKAFLVRNRKWEVSMALDKDCSDEAYHLGRLFAALEKTQEDAAGRELNSTIKDRYFGAASASPGSIFPLLLKLHQHHMNKIENVGLRVNREKLIGEICGRISRFPTHLPLEKQGLFYIAYYHQRQDFFTKKSDAGKETTTNV